MQVVRQSLSVLAYFKACVKAFAEAEAQECIIAEYLSVC